MYCSESGSSNFRNLETGRHSWDSGLNLLAGPNGAGKTNLLETIHILTGWNPFKGLRKSPLVCWDSQDRRGWLEGRFEGEEEVLVQTSVSSRCFMKCDGKRSNCTSIRFRIPALAFLPGQMALIEGGPAVRRRFLDVLCALLYPLYGVKITEYRRLVKHKRAMLINRESTDLADRTMAPIAAWIWNCREKAVNALKYGLSAFEELLPAPVTLELLHGGAGTDLQDDEMFFKALRLNRSRESGSRRPLVGPHRDDILISGNGREASSVFSRGQRRRTALALVMAAGWTVNRRLRRSPVLLLDEIASELDQEGREIMVSALVKSRWQVFAATAEDNLPDWPGSIYNVGDGLIRPVSKSG